MSKKNAVGGKSAINFPVETNDGNVWKKANIIFYQYKGNIHTQEVDIDLLRYAYIVVDRRGEASLFLFDNHQHYIPVHFNGFKDVYADLSEKLGFNDQVFFEYLNSKEIVKEQVWRKKRARNYQVLKDGGFSDYDEGFEIQSPEKEFISWDTPYGELAKSKQVYIGESPYGQKLLKFKHPVRIGNILLENLRAYLDNLRRDDVPMLHFYADCYDETNSHNSYWELKGTLGQGIDAREHLYGYERDDQHCYRFEIEGMEFSLVYTFDSQWQFNGGCTSFSIKNNREYADLLVDLDYENRIEIGEFIVLNEPAFILGNYKKEAQIKRRPEKLNLRLGDKPVIWLDKNNDRIGFADKTRCRVQSIDSVESFAIQNVLPAKGAGGAYLLIKCSDGSSFEVMKGKCHLFDPLREKIAQMTNKPVGVEPEYHDC